MVHFFLFQELLFCETCDTVLCTLCTGGNHSRPDDPAQNRPGGGKEGSPGAGLSGLGLAADEKDKAGEIIDIL